MFSNPTVPACAPVPLTEIFMFTKMITVRVWKISSTPDLANFELIFLYFLLIFYNKYKSTSLNENEGNKTEILICWHLMFKNFDSLT
jgi:hypothetical protein